MSLFPHISAVVHPYWWGLEHFLRSCAWVCFVSSALNNFLPCEEMFEKNPEVRRWFLHFVAIASFFALNLRRNQPSLGVLQIPGRKDPVAGCDHQS